jgi:hypothetical protein
MALEMTAGSGSLSGCASAHSAPRAEGGQLLHASYEQGVQPAAHRSSRVRRLMCARDFGDPGPHTAPLTFGPLRSPQAYFPAPEPRVFSKASPGRNGGGVETAPEGMASIDGGVQRTVDSSYNVAPPAAHETQTGFVLLAPAVPHRIRS